MAPARAALPAHTGRARRLAARLHPELWQPRNCRCSRLLGCVACSKRFAGSCGVFVAWWWHGMVVVFLPPQGIGRGATVHKLGRSPRAADAASRGDRRRFLLRCVSCAIIPVHVSALAHVVAGKTQRRVNGRQACMLA